MCNCTAIELAFDPKAVLSAPFCGDLNQGITWVKEHMLCQKNKIDVDSSVRCLKETCRMPCIEDKHMHIIETSSSQWPRIADMDHYF